MSVHRAFGSWRPVLRLARRDARRHLARTVLASLLIALPIAALVAFAAMTAGGTPSREQALSTIPEGAQAVLTATTVPREAPPFAQLPEGAPWLWIDDPDTLPASEEEIASLLAPGVELLEYWLSPELIASTELGLDPGEERSAGAGADQLSSIDFASLGTVTLQEAEPDALSLLAPQVIDGRLPSDPSELLISSTLAERFDIAPGDSLGLLAPPDHGWRSNEGNTMAAMQDSERGYSVVGIADSPSDQAWSTSGWLSSLVEESPLGIQRHWLATGNEPITWEQARQLNELQAFAVSRYVLENYPPAEELYPVAIDTGMVLQQVVGIIATTVIGALLVLFLVTPAFAVSAEQSRRSLGLAAAAGAAPRDLRRTILAQGIVLGTGSGLLGVVIGFVGSLGVAASLESFDGTSADPRYGVAETLNHYPWWVLPVGVLVAMILGAVAALPPARTAAKLAPVDALRDRRTSPSGRGRGAHLVDAIGGPALLIAAIVLGASAFARPMEGAPADAVARGHAAPAAGPGILGLLVLLAFLLAAVGIVLCVRAAIALLGRRGVRAGPALRLALRDAADHPSRTVPAALGVLFAVAAASFFVVTTASSISNDRDQGGTLQWEGTFMVSPEVAVNDEFDRLLATAAIDEFQDWLPQIVGSESVFEVSRTSSIHVRLLMPEGRECPAAQAVHTDSAINPGAPLRCVDENSRAAYNPSYRIGGLNSQSDTMLFTGDALIATGLPGAEQAAAVLDSGGVIVNDATLIDSDGLVRVALDSEAGGGAGDADRVVRVPGIFLQGMGAPFLLAPETAQVLGVDALHYLGEIAVVSTPLGDGELLSLLDNDHVLSSLTMVYIPDGRGPLSPVIDRFAVAAVWAPILLFVGVAVTATAVSVLLSATQGRKDAATMYAIGADRWVLTRFGLARAGMILAVGMPAGLAAGIGLGAYLVAWNRHLEASGAWLSTVPVAEVQAGIALGVTVVGLASALLFARPPRRFERRTLD